jgi:hypothetical protein
MLIMNGVEPGSVRPQSTICRHASSSTQLPIPRISPLSSATGRNASGESKPRLGCCQRISASAPLIRPLARSTIGW